MRLVDYLSLSLRSLRRSKLRSLLTIFAIVIGATGITVMLTFVTSVKNLTVASFVKTGQIKQIQVSQQTNLTYDPSGTRGNYSNSPETGSSSTPTTVLTPALEAKIGGLPNVNGVAGMFRGHEQAISNISYAGKKWVVQTVIGYEANGVIKPALLAGRDLTAADTANQILISTSYADVMGFSNDYTKLVGTKIALHTSNGYTGYGANLPTRLSPQIQCGQQSKACFGGPTSGLPAIDIPATIVGVLDGSNSGDQPIIMMQMSNFLKIYNQSRPNNVTYDFQNQTNNGPTGNEPGGNGNNGGNKVTSSGSFRSAWAMPTR